MRQIRLKDDVIAHVPTGKNPTKEARYGIESPSTIMHNGETAEMHTTFKSQRYQPISDSRGNSQPGANWSMSVANPNEPIGQSEFREGD